MENRRGAGSEKRMEKEKVRKNEGETGGRRRRKGGSSEVCE